MCLVLICIVVYFAAADEAEDAGVVSAATAAQVALARAERSIDWAASAEVAGVVPNVASAARRLATWLRSTAVALSETSRLLAEEKREKRTQRRLLHDEIHTLRQQVCGMTLRFAIVCPCLPVAVLVTFYVAVGRRICCKRR